MTAYFNRRFLPTQSSNKALTEYYEKNDLDINKAGIQMEIYDKYKMQCLLKYQIWYFANYLTYAVRIFLMSSILLKFKIRRF